MKLIEFNWHPSQRQLRQFGLLALPGLPLLGWVFTGRPTTLEAANLPLLGGLALAGLALAVCGYAAPRVVKPVFLALSLLVLPIGLVVGEVVMLLVFFAVITPVALAFRLAGRDALARRFEPGASTYWQPKSRTADPRQYYRQF